MLVGAAALLLGACGIIRNFPTYHYRLTVEVDTPKGLRTGSSVIEVRTGAVHLGGIGGGASAEVSGEAVTVDLGARGLLFALLRSEGNGGWAGGIVPTFAARPEADANHSDDDTMAIMFENMLANKRLIVLPRYYPANARVSGPRRSDKPQSDYPLLVRFGDIKDPKSVAQVDPDDLEKSLGSGVTLKRITVQLTDDPVTTGIEKRLGWLGKYPEPSLNPAHSNSDFSLAATLHHGDFRKSEK